MPAGRVVLVLAMALLATDRARAGTWTVPIAGLTPIVNAYYPNDQFGLGGGTADASGLPINPATIANVQLTATFNTNGLALFDWDSTDPEFFDSNAVETYGTAYEDNSHSCVSGECINVDQPVYETKVQTYYGGAATVTAEIGLNAIGQASTTDTGVSVYETTVPLPPTYGGQTDVAEGYCFNPVYHPPLLPGLSGYTTCGLEFNQTVIVTDEEQIILEYYIDQYTTTLTLDLSIPSNDLGGLLTTGVLDGINFDWGTISSRPTPQNAAITFDADPSAAPEPSGLALIGVALPLLLRVRRARRI